MMIPDPDEFCFMRQGKITQAATPSDLILMNPIYQTKPDAQHALLCLHGFGSSPAVFRYLTPLLSSFDTLSLPKLPGHGSSLHEFSHVTHQKWVQTAEDSFHMLQKTHQTVSVLGLSLGGLLGCHLAKNYPVDHLYLLAPALALQLPMTVIQYTLYGLSLLGIKKIPNRAGDIYTGTHAELTYRYLSNHAILELFDLIRTFKYENINCPTHLFLGKHDHVIDNKKVEQLVKNTKNLSTHYLNDSAHALPLEQDLLSIISIIQN